MLWVSFPCITRHFLRGRPGSARRSGRTDQGSFQNPLITLVSDIVYVSPARASYDARWLLEPCTYFPCHVTQLAMPMCSKQSPSSVQSRFYANRRATSATRFVSSDLKLQCKREYYDSSVSTGMMNHTMRYLIRVPRRIIWSQTWYFFSALSVFQCATATIVSLTSTETEKDTYETPLLLPSRHLDRLLFLGHASNRL